MEQDLRAAVQERVAGWVVAVEAEDVVWAEAPALVPVEIASVRAAGQEPLTSSARPVTR